MDELEWAIFLERATGVLSLLLPVAAGVLTVLVSRRQSADRVRTGFIGTLAVVSLGAGGSFVHGASIIGALMNTSHIPLDLVAQAWHRMWYPLGIGLIVGFALALYSLLPERSAA